MTTCASAADSGPCARSRSGEALLALWALVVLLVLCQIGLLAGGSARSLHGTTDFRAFYGAGKLVAIHHGDGLYNYTQQQWIQRQWVGPEGQTLPFLYPAFASLLFVPLALVSYKAAFGVFLAANLVLLELFRRWTKSQIGGTQSYATVVSCLIAFGTVPVAMAVLQGQVSLILLGLFAFAHSLLRQGKDARAGAVLALTLIKFQLAIPIFILFCCWKRRRVVCGMAAGGIALAIISVLVTGPAGSLEYLHGMGHITAATAQTPLAAKAMYGMFPSDMPNLHGLCYVLAGTSAAPWMTVLLSLALMGWACLRNRGLGSALCVAMLVSYHLQAYDMTLLLMPIGLCAGYLLGEPRGTLSRVAGTFVRKKTSLWATALVLISVPVGAPIVYAGKSWLFLVATVVVLVCLESQGGELADATA